VVVGFDDYTDAKYEMGIDQTIRIPVAIDQIESVFKVAEKNKIEGNVTAVKGKDVRIILQQFDTKGLPFRSWPGSPPDGKKISEVIKIKVMQDGKDVPLHIEYDKVIWSGLSWAAAEIKQGSFDPVKPLQVHCSTDEKDELKLVANVYAVSYTSIR